MDHVKSYYAATAHQHADWPVLQDTVDCDVCVIGAGFTGLSSALFLSEAGFDVVVLEAVRVGFGASGRNGGQLVNSFSRDIDIIEQRYGQESARLIGNMMFEGGDIIRQRIEHYGIDCDYRPGGIFAALNARQMSHLRAQQKRWQHFGHHQLALLDEEGIRREVASERYVGGLLDKRGGHLHPLNLALGEAEAIRHHGGRIYEHSAVTRVDYGSQKQVYTAQGCVRAKYIIWAANAYLPETLEPRLTRRSMPCGSQIVVSEKLSADLALSLLPNNRCVEDCNYLLDYFRLTADNRLLFGGGVIYGAREPDDVVALIRPKLLKTFPQLQGINIDYAWSGNFLLTLSRMPQLGQFEPGVYFIQGDSGHGVTFTHLAGKLVSEAIAGNRQRFDAFARLPHLPFPGGHRLRIPFTAIGATWYSLRDRLGI
ncbi:gamma-glutamylputrescine oxidoreductase [Erwinia sp. OLTSP20]|uniref:NAD(P)/FAD-dependent oxidoreductase n=1 Tax=unclassified Erwinia TaxID=2622719 RepID=UPI000C1966E4|nr:MULTISPECIES: FAD-binding oxidoreductase [unclassified Erwinia]PIJ50859.1 gamma-glutamylputrescine oxidoreductase [Erwinia sp. OAMSP11]PIJ73245.1 gamma-glutamylputrescine oxidoreductase [Erwinia sp. OLSSP12]PIJ82259.1 gamma-glutamylputrescine oxidoreductase [Erwinia sp. OLCASP19]PIJ85411.1 gamma-glutamylputrescine oxidoreductase [Erwinia sp. OLMTSP26]PIJ87108.1 gamma-glutamylputrescine oxidoreductase [Erwinia sp. OLMDSP33]